jgi:hypothetical protein
MTSGSSVYESKQYKRIQYIADWVNKRPRCELLGFCTVYALFDRNLVYKRIYRIDPAVKVWDSGVTIKTMPVSLSSYQIFLP